MRRRAGGQSRIAAPAYTTTPLACCGSIAARVTISTVGNTKETRYIPAYIMYACSPSAVSIHPRDAANLSSRRGRQESLYAPPPAARPFRSPVARPSALAFSTFLSIRAANNRPRPRTSADEPQPRCSSIIHGTNSPNHSAGRPTDNLAHLALIDSTRFCITDGALQL